MSPGAPRRLRAVACPVGTVTIGERDGAIVALVWGEHGHDAPSPVLARAERWLARYFDGSEAPCDVPLAPAGSAFQRRVWAEIARIPFGAALSYGQIARHLSSAARAVGQACGANPVPLLVPCHRVLGAHGALGGYSGGRGLATKRALLAHEGIMLAA